jgi:cbb3-type cytochrome oxidase maturation protein
VIEAGAVLLGLGVVLFAGSALAAFCWAARDGQFENLDAAPGVIFDDAEEPADCFPDARSRAFRDAATSAFHGDAATSAAGEAARK